MFFGAAQAGKLKPVENYLSRKPQKPQQSDDELLRKADAFFSAHEAFSEARK
jgi:hypothetical protein